MQDNVRDRPSKKFLWSHQGLLHRVIVRIANKGLSLIPFKLKYTIAARMKKKHPPYSLVEGMNVIQVGAPFDTLMAGRSRGMYFSKLVGSDGRALIVEPLNESVMAFREKVDVLGLKNIIVHESGAWSEPGESYINVDLKHPATNYTGNTVDYSQERESQFKQVGIKLDTLDNIAKTNGLERVDMISITTNWAEEEILDGAKELMGNGVKYIALAYGKNGEDYSVKMNALGYRQYSHDDRGVTYVKTDTLGET